MKKGKFFAILFFASTVFMATAVAVEPVAENQEEGPIDLILRAGKQIWSSITDGANRAVEDFNDAISSVTSKITVGEWRFDNGKYSTTILCEKNGNMTVTQTNVNGEIVYTGTYAASTNKITFNVQKKSTKILFMTLHDSMDEKWEIDYSIPFASGEMKIKSKQIPADGNGYDFSRPTIFTAAKSEK
ncbi:MAG: hypothetical protein IKP60_02455 [Treponema sp.]|nr:hypothetical protein [Treponema sp.]